MIASTPRIVITTTSSTKVNPPTDPAVPVKLATLVTKNRNTTTACEPHELSP